MTCPRPWSQAVALPGAGGLGRREVFEEQRRVFIPYFQCQEGKARPRASSSASPVAMSCACTSAGCESPASPPCLQEGRLPSPSPLPQGQGSAWGSAEAAFPSVQSPGTAELNCLMKAAHLHTVASPTPPTHCPW